MGIDTAAILQNLILLFLGVKILLCMPFLKGMLVVDHSGRARGLELLLGGLFLNS